MPDKTIGSGYLSRMPRCAAVANIVISLFVMVGWHAHWQKILQLLPGTAPMQFNTALCFLLSGAALFLLTTPRSKHAVPLGAVVAIIGLLTLLEYVSGFDFHIDELFFTPFFEAATAYPGRMSPLAAACFTLAGIAVALCGAGVKKPRRLEAAGVLMCVVGIIALVALVGFAFGISSAYGWGAYSSLALNTTVLFLLLSAGLLVFVWRQAREMKSDFVRWLPVTGSFTLMAMVAVVAAGDVSKLQTAIFWRRHTIEVIFSAQSFENNLIDLQRGMRGYVTSGDTNALASFRRADDWGRRTLAGLFKMTEDNAAQQKKLGGLVSAFESLLQCDDRLISLYDLKGAKAVFDIETDREARACFGRAHDAQQAFAAGEQELLDLRERSEQSDVRNTERLLVSGSALAVGLLLLAHFMASHELAKRRRAEERLERQAEVLRRSNTELEQFAYVASHDMREPLRAVTGFAQILRRQFADKPDAETERVIARIVDGARRMSNIIDDLLTLSGISSGKKPFEKTALETPLLLALENLSVAVRERGAIVRHGPLPELMMDGSQMALLFQNLIGNAIKFCQRQAPEVDVTASREADGLWEISVRDNGIGIDPKYFGRIFGIFQRLHTRDDYPGTGIGLAICKKIVERHGGRIWLESEPGVGTVFRFTLADRRPETYEAEQSSH